MNEGDVVSILKLCQKIFPRLVYLYIPTVISITFCFILYLFLFSYLRKHIACMFGFDCIFYGLYEIL